MSGQTKEQVSAEQLNAVLMSFIHDIKNSLLMSLASLEQLYCSLDNEQPELQQHVSLIQYELQRINNSLIQLLSLYKMETRLFSIHADQYNIYDFLDEIIINNTQINENKDFSIKLVCNSNLEWFFDRDLIAAVINSIINNSSRYAHCQIQLSAQIENNYLVIKVEDDGDGFPEYMFIAVDSLETAINMQSGSTGMGLYFAEKIANIHQNGHRKGSTLIDNKSTLGGGRFILNLP